MCLMTCQEYISIKHGHAYSIFSGMYKLADLRGLSDVNYAVNKGLTVLIFKEGWVQRNKTCFKRNMKRFGFLNHFSDTL